MSIIKQQLIEEMEELTFEEAKYVTGDEYQTYKNEAIQSLKY